MKVQKIVAILAFISLLSCNKTKNEVDFLEENQNKDIENYDKTFANAGELIADYSIFVQPNNEQKEEFGEELIPYINIEDSKEFIAGLQNPDEILVKETSARLIIDYPMLNPALIEISEKNGFTRKKLIELITLNYNKIYNEEEATAKTKVIPINERTSSINRNETDGKYGIYGHDLEDLDLSGIKVYQNQAGVITISLQIES